MRKRVAIGLAGALACALAGCGTMNNLVPPPGDTKKEAPRPDAARVYGGVELDARVGASWLTAPFLNEPPANVGPVERFVDTTCKVGIGTYLLWVDLPLSAVGDTLTLPITVPVTLQRQGARSRRAGARTSEDEDSADADD
jgi:uncharacterized protein YceK